MANLIIDEWLWKDLARAKGSDRGREAFEFLESIFEKCDKIVIVKASEFAQKIYQLFKRPDQEAKLVARFFKPLFLENSIKVHYIEEDELPAIPEELKLSVNPDDHYLVQAYLLSKSEALVTTDAKLKSAVEKAGLNCQFRDQFLPEYIKQFHPKYKA